MRSFLRWAGSKRLQLPELRRYWSDEYRKYIEPFAGSGCLFFDLSPKKAALSDINPDLIRTLRAVRNDVIRVVEGLRRLKRGKAAYYSIRSVDPSTLGEAEAAARFIYLNSYCFNGLYRTNASGEFNVPYWPAASRIRIDEERLFSASKLLQKASLVCCDFQQAVSSAKEGDFVYLDPPYAVQKRRVFSEYLPGSFSGADLNRLGETLRVLDAVGATFVISYADSPEGRRLLKPWGPRRIRVRRHIAGFTAKRRIGYELLATNSKESQ